MKYIYIILILIIIILLLLSNKNEFLTQTIDPDLCRWIDKDNIIHNPMSPECECRWVNENLQVINSNSISPCTICYSCKNKKTGKIRYDTRCRSAGDEDLLEEYIGIYDVKLKGSCNL